MMMLMVVPLKEHPCPGTCIFRTAELGGKVGAILQRLELRLRIGIVVREVWPTMGLGNAQVGQQLRHTFTCHGTPAICVQRELVRANPLFGTRFGDERLGQFGRLAFTDHPADHIAAEYIHNHIQIVVGPLARAFELGDIPAPQLLRLRSEQLRLGVGRVAQLIASFPHFALCCQNTVHRAPRAEIGRLVEQGRIHLAWGAILKARTIEQLTHGTALLSAQGTWWGRTRAGRCWFFGRLSSAVVAAARHPQRPTGFDNTNRLGQFVHRIAYDGSSGCGAGCGSPSSCATFFWTSIISSACVRRVCKRAFSLRNCASSSASGSDRVGLGPRGLAGGAAAGSSQHARNRRHFTRWDEYNPSRRSNAPIWPLWVQASASFKMRSFSAALKVRRDAFGTTSGSGGQDAGGWGTTIREGL